MSANSTEQMVAAIVKACQQVEKGRYSDEGGRIGESIGSTIGGVAGAAGGGVAAFAGAPLGAAIGRLEGTSIGSGIDRAESAYKVVKPKLEKFMSSFKGSKPAPALSAGARMPSVKTPKAGYKLKTPKIKVG